MLKRLAEWSKFVEISGFREAKIENAREFMETARKQLPEGVEAQLFDADLVATWQHPYFAALNALAAFKSGRNLSNSVAVESALYASAQRQIKKALEFIGVKAASRNVAVLVVGGDAGSVRGGFEVLAAQMGGKPDETVLELSPPKIVQIRRAFDVSDLELQAADKSDKEQALVDLIIERMALLSTRL